MSNRRFLAVVVLAGLISWGCNDSATAPLGGDGLLLGKVASNGGDVCSTIDFSGFAHGDKVVKIPSGFGFDLNVNVVGYGSNSTNNGVIWDTDYTGGFTYWSRGVNTGFLAPDPDLRTPGEGYCGDCVGLGNVLIIEDNRGGIDAEGDSDTGGLITLTGFAGNGAFFVRSFKALDQERDEGAITLSVDGIEVGSSTARGDGSVEDILTETTTFGSTAEFELDGSGGVDDIEICKTETFGVGRMTGGGGQIVMLDGTGVEVRITRGFTIHCDIALSNNLEINWPDNKWHLDKPLTWANCTDEEGVAPEPPPAPFDTFWGEGIGRLNGVDGYLVEFIFQDAGEPGGKNDKAMIRITGPGGVVLEVGNWSTDGLSNPDQVGGLIYLDHGNLQAHYDQPHGCNVNKC